MDPERHACTWKNEPVTLTVTEFLILQALASHPGVVKSRNALMDAAYDDQVYVDERTIDSHVKRLRKKFHAKRHRIRHDRNAVWSRLPLQGIVGVLFAQCARREIPKIKTRAFPGRQNPKRGAGSPKIVF
jgi:hypothetical protein